MHASHQEGKIAEVTNLCCSSNFEAFEELFEEVPIRMLYYEVKRGRGGG